MKRTNLAKAVAQVEEGGVIAYPTEAVFGLGCDPMQAEAVARILQIKQRPVRKGLILVVSNLAQLEGLIAPLSADEQAMLMDARHPTSWLLPKGKFLPDYICGDFDSVAVRLIRHPLIRQLCDLLDGPLVSTSANHRGRPAARTALQVRYSLGAEVDYVLPGRTLGYESPSRIIDLKKQQRLR